MIFIKEESKDKGSIAASKHQHPAASSLSCGQRAFRGVIGHFVWVGHHSSFVNPRSKDIFRCHRKMGSLKVEVFESR
jgi:hypothetical protein